MFRRSRIDLTNMDTRFITIVMILLGAIFATSNAFARSAVNPALAGSAIKAPAFAATIDVGVSHTIALHADGTVWAWGANNAGQLGDGSTISRAVPAQVENLSDVVAVSAGNGHSIALRRDRIVWTWGDNSAGQLGDASTGYRTTPAPVAGLSNVIAIAAGGVHSVALTEDGIVWTWGGNSDGQLGNSGSTTARNMPAPVASLKDVVAIAAGMSHTLALRRNGAVWSWGSNLRGQLGERGISSRAFPAKTPGVNGVIAITAGDEYSVALRRNGSIWCWGDNSMGQLGNGTTAKSQITPTRVKDLKNVVMASAGSRHMAALDAEGAVWIWGANSSGQLGSSDTGNQLFPTPFSDLSDVIMIVAGGDSTLAVQNHGEVWTWGANYQGQLGDGSILIRPVPKPVSTLNGINDFIALDAGASHTIALRSDGSVWTWGLNSSGQVGNGSITLWDGASPPAQVADLLGIVAVAAGGNHTLAARVDGGLWTWGANDYGQLGNGSTGEPWSTPMPVKDLTGVKAISAGSSHTVALRQDGTLWTWGGNSFGQLGDGSVFRSIPAPVSSLEDVAAIAAGDWHTVAVRNDGSVWTWGNNSSGQLGDGGNANRSSPFQMSQIKDINSVAAGSTHTLALNKDGLVWEWGSLSSTMFNAPPMLAPNLDNVVQIAAGADHAVALRNDGVVWTWGDNSFGQLGDDNNTTRAEPAPVAGLTEVIAVTAGTFYTAALRKDGSIWTWGANDIGQLGEKRTYRETHPVPVVAPDGTSPFNLFED